jgi:membrane protein
MANKRFSRLYKILTGAVADADEIFQLNGRLERFAHFLALVTRQFIRHRCLVRASALSYSTLLAMIPLLVVGLSLTTRWLSPQEEAQLSGFVEKVAANVAPAANIPAGATVVITNSAAVTETNLAGAVTATNVPAATPALPVVTPPATINPQSQVAQEIHDLVKKASSGTLGATGFIFLVITAVSLLRGIEETFNDIWGVTRGRSWMLQFVLYWCIITLGPLLLGTALGLTGSAHLQNMRAFFESSPLLAPVIKHLLPVGVLSFSLTLFYKLTPNTKVEFSAAAIGGLCAGVAWHIYNQLGFVLAARALSASKFYGGIFLIVLVMGGLYILWLILLFGTQIAYAYQNRVAYLQDRLAENVNQRGREFVALRIMTCLGQRFQNGLRPATVPEISTELGVPSRLTQSVLRVLAATRLVTEVTGAEAAFMPARPLDAINAHDILLAMRTGTGQELPLAEDPALAEIYGEFARIEQAERTAASGISLLTLTHRQPPRASLAEPKTVEPEKIVEPPPVAEMKSEPEKIEPDPEVIPKPEPFPEKVETSEPPPAPEEPEEPPRREPARPEEHREFPL